MHVAALVLLGLVWAVGPVQAQEAPETSRPGARLAFPNHGVVNAFVVFVQFPDEPDGAGGFGDDGATEWPHARSLGPDRSLPAWAENGGLLAPPGTPPDAYAPFSLSAFYDLMSQGRFQLRGYVYPRVYHPREAVDWYHANRGALPTGASRLSHEILASDELQAYFNDNPDGLDLAALDTYRNGTNTYAPDGVFDLLVIVHRDPVLPRLRRSDSNDPLAGSSMTSLGADLEFRPAHPEDYKDPSLDAFDLAGVPVMLGGLRVLDNVTSGSGVITYALSQKQAVRIIAHEIGHRQFGFYHTCTNPLGPTADCLGIMGGSYLTMSAGDRIKLGWADVVPVDVPLLGRLPMTFPDALTSGRVFRLRTGADQCGDVIVEARRWTNPWDAPPNPDRPGDPFFGNDDGDDADLFLPDEGLYLYKAPELGNPFCGGRFVLDLDEHFFSSLENNGMGRRLVPFGNETANALRAFRIGGSYRTAYMPGDTYAPFTRPRFFFHLHPTLDAKLSLTDITRTADGFAAEIWTDHLAGFPDEERLTVTAYPNPFTGGTILRYELPEETHVTLTVYDLRGRHIATLAEGLHQPGVHELPFYATGLPAGRYWCRLDLDGRVTTQPLFVVR